MQTGHNGCHGAKTCVFSTIEGDQREVCVDDVHGIIGVEMLEGTEGGAPVGSCELHWKREPWHLDDGHTFLGGGILCVGPRQDRHTMSQSGEMA